MARKPRKEGRRRPVRSADQRAWNVAVGLASKAWLDLSDEQYLIWNVAAKSRRMSGQRYFTGVNAPRIRDRQEPLKVPPAVAAYSGKRILKRFTISNRGDRITLVLVVSRVPGVRITVWGSRPCNRGISVGIRCPRLGELPRAHGRDERDYLALLPEALGVYREERRGVGWEAHLYSAPGRVGGLGEAV